MRLGKGRNDAAGASNELPFDKLLVVYSPAGGNGKSEIAANMAYYLAKAGYRIWIIDANTQAPALDLILSAPTLEAPGLTDFLKDPEMASFPYVPLPPRCRREQFRGELLFTPSGPSDAAVQTHLSELSWDDASIERVQQALLSGIDENHVDLCIIDTHQGFDLINRIWLGITCHLLLVSRLNDLSLRNLRVFLDDTVLTDICHIMLVFNNVHVSSMNPASHRYLDIDKDMENEVVIERLEAIINGEIVLDSIFSDQRGVGNECYSPEVFHRAFLYSPRLAMYLQEGARIGVFSEEYPTDPFSITMRECAEHLMNSWFNPSRARPPSPDANLP